MVDTPFDEIKKSLKNDLPEKLLDSLPDKWEKIGDILIIRLLSEFNKYKRQVGEIYAEVLNCKTVLQDLSGISGVYREPNVEIIYGIEDTTTVHKENGILYKIDPQKIMFSSGNMDERIRMANISNQNETVVDLFAGIGYFTLPLAVYSKSQKVFACEMNQVAYDFLCQNIVLNDVTSIVKPLLGDNRKVAPKKIADRVIMGYIRDTYRFLPIALDCLKNGSGFIHYHEVVPNDLFPNRSLDKIREIMVKHDRGFQILKIRRIKSYAPGISHMVIDLKIG